MPEFKLSCPSCYSPDHTAYRLHIIDDFYVEVYGETMRHCEACGQRFQAARAVELRELEPTTEHREREIAIRRRLLETRRRLLANIATGLIN